MTSVLLINSFVSQNAARLFSCLETCRRSTYLKGIQLWNEGAEGFGGKMIRAGILPCSMAYVMALQVLCMFRGLVNYF